MTVMTVMKDLLQLQNTYIVTDTHARLLEMLSHLKTFVIISVKTKFRLILIFSRNSDLTSTNVSLSVCLSVRD